MSRSHLEDVRGNKFHMMSGFFGSSQLTMTGNVTLDSNEAPILQFYDPNGADRTLTLPAAERGLNYLFVHIGSANTLTIQNAAGSTIAILNTTASCWVASTDSAWYAIIDTAFASGTAHKGGLVPDPGVTPGTDDFLREDMTWATPGGGGASDAYNRMTDGTGTATASGLTDVFKFRSSDSSITPAVTDNDVTHGDNLDLIVAPGSVDHDALLNFVADEHVAHAGVTLTAGVGLAGGGDITVNRTFDIDINGLTGDTPVLSDSFAFYDADGTDHNKATFTTLNGILDHDTLLNFVAAEHSDHSAISVTAGTALSGGGTIDATRTLNLDITGLAADTPVTADEFVFYDIDGVDTNKVTLANLAAALQGELTKTGLDANLVTGTVGTDGNLVKWNADGDAVDASVVAANVFVTGGTDLTVPDGGTGASTFTDGGILLGSGTDAITAMAVLADGAIVVGDGTTDPVPLTAFSSSTGNVLLAKGGTGASTAAGARANLVAEQLGVSRDINNQTGTTYQFVSGDEGKTITYSNTSPVAAKIPLNSTVAFPLGTYINLHSLNTGQVTVSGETGAVEIRSKNGTKLSGQYSSATVQKIASDTWLLAGDVTT